MTGDPWYAAKGHTTQRFLERFDVVLADDDYHDLCRECREGRAMTLPDPLGEGREIRLPKLGPRHYKVVWDPSINAIVTVLRGTGKPKSKRRGA